ncbi:MAG: sodium:proton antiporter [Phycisphaerales bacterium]|nr:sodium:proton antiporter [Phycisphaerales bacterium]
MTSEAAGGHPTPHVFWVWPFVALLGCIALLPLIRATHHWWEHNLNRLLVAASLAACTLLYYGFRGYGVVDHSAGASKHASATHDPASAADDEDPADAHRAAAQHDAPQSDVDPALTYATETTHAEHAYTTPGFATVWAIVDHAVLKEYVPFLTLLFSLYVIAGGIVVRGDLRATPMTNAAIIGVGGLLASLIGTTGASMVLIRILLKTNAERKFVVHTVVFFIFIVSNIGGTLLPIGDPPLFLGYLRGVPFFWTLGLYREWLFLIVLLLVVYFAIDTYAYRHESVKDLQRDNTERQPLRLAGAINIPLLLGVVFAVATLDSSKAFPGTDWHPFPYFRELVQLALTGASLALTSKVLRKENEFNYAAILEVACLFIGIFITMQVPLEILNTYGSQLGLTEPWQFFWATGVLSSFLDNAPTYVVFFETARTLPLPETGALELAGGGAISATLLVPIAAASVFMGANSYIGNGPNFMVKTIAEQAGVRMPSFFGYMMYSGAILIPAFIIMTFVFFV